MPAYTNMAWPGDPYGTGQLWRKEPRLLVGLAVHGVNGKDQNGLGFAITYLRLSRTPPIDLAAGLSFGFRAAVTVTLDEHDQLVRLFDLEVLRARRLAKIIAGYHLADDLAAVCAISQQCGRGIQGLRDWWAAHDDSSAGLARRFDLGREETSASVGLAAVARVSGIAFPAEHLAEEPTAKRLAATATERALLCALVAGRSLGQAFWEGYLDCDAIVAANAEQCLKPVDRRGRGVPSR
jgi:hypothetical protein